MQKDHLRHEPLPILTVETDDQAAPLYIWVVKLMHHASHDDGSISQWVGCACKSVCQDLEIGEGTQGAFRKETVNEDSSPRRMDCVHVVHGNVQSQDVGCFGVIGCDHVRVIASTTTLCARAVGWDGVLEDEGERCVRRHGGSDGEVGVGRTNTGLD